MTRTKGKCLHRFVSDCVMRDSFKSLRIKIEWFICSQHSKFYLDAQKFGSLLRVDFSLTEAAEHTENFYF